MNKTVACAANMLQSRQEQGKVKRHYSTAVQEGRGAAGDV